MKLRPPTIKPHTRWFLLLALLLLGGAIEGWRHFMKPPDTLSETAVREQLREASGLFLQEQRELLDRSRDLAGALTSSLTPSARAGEPYPLLKPYGDLWGISVMLGDTSILWHGYPPTPDGLPDPGRQEPRIRIEQQNNVLFWECRVPFMVRDSSGVTAYDLYTSKRILQSTSLPIGMGSEYRFTDRLQKDGRPPMEIRLFNPMPDSVFASERLSILEGDSAGAVFVSSRSDSLAPAEDWKTGTRFWRSLYLLLFFLAGSTVFYLSYHTENPWEQLLIQSGIITLGWALVRLLDLPERILLYLRPDAATDPFLRELSTFGVDAAAVLLLALTVYLGLRVRSLRFRSNSFLSTLSLAALSGTASCGFLISIIDRCHALLTTPGAPMNELQIIPSAASLMLYISVGIMLTGLIMLLLTIIRLLLLSSHDQLNLPVVMMVIGFTLCMGGVYLLVPGAVLMPGTWLYGSALFLLLAGGLRFGMRKGRMFPLSSVRGIVFGSVAVTLAAVPLFQSALDYHTERRLLDTAADFAERDESEGRELTFQLLNTLGDTFSQINAESLINRQIFVGQLFNETIETFIAGRSENFSYDLQFISDDQTTLASYSTDLNSPSWLESYPVRELQTVMEMQQITRNNPRPVVQQPQLITSKEYESFHRGWIPLFGETGEPIAWILASVYLESPNFNKPLRAVLASLHYSDWRASYYLQEFRDSNLVRSSRRGITGYYPTRNRLPENYRERLGQDSLLVEVQEQDRKIYRTLYRQHRDGRVIKATTIIPGFRNRLYHFFQFNFTLLLFGLLVIFLRELMRPGRFRFLEKSRRFRHRLLDRFLLAVLLFLGILVVTTHYAIHEQNKEVVRQSLYQKMDNMGQQVQQKLAEQSPGMNIGYALLDSLALPLDVDASLYRRHAMVESTTPQIYRQHLLPAAMPFEIFRELYRDKRTAAFQQVTLASQPLLIGYRSILRENREPVAAIAIPTFLESPKFEQQLLETTSYLISIYLIVFGGFIAGSMLITRELTDPLKEIQKGLNEISKGNFETTIPVTGDDEIGKLAAAYNEMILRLRQVRRELADAEREAAWKEMAQQVAHEIKNPLTPMKLSVQHLKRQLSEDGLDKEALRESIRRITENLVEQIDTLNAIASDFSKFSQPIERNFREVNLNSILRSVAELYGNDDRVTLETDLTGFPLIISGDEDELRRVVVNLVKNAYEATPERGTICLRSYQKKGSAFMEVEDDGSGIPESYKSRIFVPNFSTKSSGTGLGLAIAKKIIEAHEGSVSFASIENQGTTFVIKIPLK